MVNDDHTVGFGFFRKVVGIMINTGGFANEKRIELQQTIEIVCGNQLSFNIGLFGGFYRLLK